MIMKTYLRVAALIIGSGFAVVAGKILDWADPEWEEERLRLEALEKLQRKELREQIEKLGK